MAMNYKDEHTNCSVMPPRHATRWAFTKLHRKRYGYETKNGYKIYGKECYNNGINLVPGIVNKLLCSFGTDCTYLFSYYYVEVSLRVCLFDASILFTLFS